jgi:hypothetical protein
MLYYLYMYYIFTSICIEQCTMYVGKIFNDIIISYYATVGTLFE